MRLVLLVILMERRLANLRDGECRNSEYDDVLSSTGSFFSFLIVPNFMSASFNWRKT